MTALVEAPYTSLVGARPHPRTRPWLVLAVLGVAQLMLVLDSTVVNIALPRAQQALGFSDGDRQWIVTGYSLMFGSLLLVGGRLTDIIGRKRVFVIGLVGFAAASALGGAAQSFTMLVSARALQGVFAALLAPSSLSFLATTFEDAHARARAFGLFGAVSAAGASIGLITGGVLTQYVSWRWVMYVNVIVAAVALIAATPLLPNDGSSRRRMRLDIPGGLLATAGVFAIVFGVSHAATGSNGTNGFDTLTWTCIAVGVALLATFFVVERRVPQPLLPLRVLLHRERAGAYAAMFLSAIGVFGILLFLTYYMEGTLGYSPIRAGLAFLPMAATVMVVGGIGNAWLTARVGARLMVPGGLLLAGIGMAMLTRITVEPHYASTVLPAELVMAVGLGLLFAPSFNLGTAGVAESDSGVASATVHVSQQVGGSIGTAMLNTMATGAVSGYLAAHAAGAARSLVQAQALVHSYVVVFWVSAAAFAVAAVVVAALLQTTRRRVIAIS